MMFQPVIVLVVGLGNVITSEERRRHAFVRRAEEEVEEMAKLAERERIARDLHDVLGHTLSVIALKAELAAKLSAIDPGRAAQEIRDVERVSRTALSEVRAAVEGYRGHGLRGELKSAADVLGAAGVTLAVDVEPVALPAKHETVLALAVREAVTNVVRHARATACRISVTRHSGRVVLRVEDDGIGGVPREGNGLTGMRERVAAIGGTLTLEGAGGVHLTVTVP
jgi:two-component system sensor histidine kinase DesK